MKTEKTHCVPMGYWYAALPVMDPVALMTKDEMLRRVLAMRDDAARLVRSQLTDCDVQVDCTCGDTTEL
jgi:hypothetical protein